MVLVIKPAVCRQACPIKQPAKVVPERDWSIGPERSDAWAASGTRRGVLCRKSVWCKEGKVVMVCWKRGLCIGMSEGRVTYLF